MTTATEVITFLLPRRPKPVVEKSTGLTHTWGIWLRDAVERRGRLSLAPVDALANALAQRPPLPVPKVVPMGRWRALCSLFWPDGKPPLREERGTRWAGVLGSLLLHLGFFALLLLISLIKMLLPAEETEESRTQLTLIGRGTQSEGGGAGPQTPDTGAQAAAPASQALNSSRSAKPRLPETPTAAASAAAQPLPATPAEATQPPVTPSAPAVQQVSPTTLQPKPEPPQPTSAEQPLQVTETSRPTQDFVLPPVTPPQIQLRAPQIQIPQTPVQVREIESVEIQHPVAVQQVSPRSVEVQAPAVTQVQVREREIPMPTEVPTSQAPTLQTIRLAATQAELQLHPAAAAQVRLRDIPMPPESSAATTTVASDATPAQASSAAPSAHLASNEASASAAQTAQGEAALGSSSSANAGAPPSPVSGGQSAGNLANAPGAGAKSSNTKGTPGPKIADDWGAARKAAPGSDAGADNGLKGLFNADGSSKLPDGLAGGSTVKPGVPGSRQQARLDVERSGTWLDRPAFGYQPTMFDKYWLPGSSLLQDWVRAGVQEVDIPIPGTSKHIKCVVSLLQAGGACGLYDPNMNNQPASARPPPDIPVKRNPIPVGS